MFGGKAEIEKWVKRKIGNQCFKHGFAKKNSLCIRVLREEEKEMKEISFTVVKRKIDFPSFYLIFFYLFIFIWVELFTLFCNNLRNIFGFIFFCLFVGYFIIILSSLYCGQNSFLFEENVEIALRLKWYQISKLSLSHSAWILLCTH